MRHLAIPLFLSQLAATLFMTGLIWFVQVVHYPLFTSVDESAFVAYTRRHGTRTSYVVGPPMLVELATSLAALWPTLRPDFVSPTAAITSVALVLAIWASTGLLQVPLHERLSRTRNLALINRLIQSNWLRTVAWSVRSLLLLLCLRHAL